METKTAGRSQIVARWLLIGTIALLPLYYLRFSIGGIPTNGIEILIGLAFLASLGTPARWPLWRPITLLLVGIILGVVMADNQVSALGILKGWVVMPILFFWTAFRVWRQADLKLVCRLLFWQVIAISLYALGQWLGWIPLLPHQAPDLDQYFTQGRALAIYESPNYLAMYLVPLIIFVWPVVRGWRRVFLLLPVSAVIFSGSQGGQLSLLIFGALLLWLDTRSVMAIRTTKVVFGGLAILVLLFFLFAWLKADGTTVRFLLWHEGVRLFLAHPLTGIGPGQFASNLSPAITSLDTYQTQIQSYALHPHSLLLTTLVSGGLLAALGFLGVIKAALANYWRWPFTPLRLSAALALGAILFHGLVDTTYLKNDLAIIFWLLILILMLPTETSPTPADSTE